MRQIVNLILMVWVLLVSSSCSTFFPDAAREADVSNVELVGKVVSVDALSSGETTSRKRWSVKIQILNQLSGKPVNINMGDTVILLVHSVIKTFGEDVEVLKGKTYRVIYEQDFSPIYDGPLEIRDTCQFSD